MESPSDPPRWLFAYGTLGPVGNTRGGPARWEPDAVRGRLFDLGPYPALIDLDDTAAAWVEGHRRPVSLTELLLRLDPYEGVREGLFRRDITTTRSGQSVWVYVYQRPLPSTARGPIVRWNGSEGTRRDPALRGDRRSTTRIPDSRKEDSDHEHRFDREPRNA